MKIRIILAIMATASLSGCANLGAFTNSPETAGIMGAIAGGAIDKGLLGGNGTVGAIAGGAVGYAAGKERKDALRAQRLAIGTTQCSNTQQGYYDKGVFVVTNDDRKCTSDVVDAGWRNHPDERMTNRSVRYETSRPSAPVTTSAGMTSCRRYNNDGTINQDC